jgi:3-phenylpropionate/cinnamic acid dioxygenase small subunit
MKTKAPSELCGAVGDTIWRRLEEMTDDDIKELDDLVYSYARLLDEERFEEWLDLFTDDCFYGVQLYEHFRGGLGFYLNGGEGKNSLRRRIEAYEGVPLPKTLHILSNLQVELPEPDNCAAAAYFAIYRNGALCFVGQYRHELVHKDGRWRIHSAVAVLDGAPVEDVIAVPI